MVAKRHRCSWKEKRVGRRHTRTADGCRNRRADRIVMHGGREVEAVLDLKVNQRACGTQHPCGNDEQEYNL